MLTGILNCSGLGDVCWAFDIGASRGFVCNHCFDSFAGLAGQPGELAIQVYALAMIRTGTTNSGRSNDILFHLPIFPSLVGKSFEDKVSDVII